MDLRNNKSEPIKEQTNRDKVSEPPKSEEVKPTNEWRILLNKMNKYRWKYFINGLIYEDYKLWT